MILKSVFYYKRDAEDNDKSSGYYNLYPPTVNLNMNGSDFSGRKSHTKFAYMTVQPLGTSPFLINSMLFLALTPLSVLLASLTSLFPSAFHKVSLSPHINKVSIFYFLPYLSYICKSCDSFNKFLATKSCSYLGAEICTTVACRTK